jgi:isopentenyl-diphosphate delta-isomerase
MRDIVNEQDEVIGKADKDEIVARRLICRVAFIMLANSQGELLLHQRAATKKAYPLFWSGAAAGHLISGESYEAGAHRELREELGIDTPLEFVGKFYSEEDREMVGVFLGFYDGELKTEPREVERVDRFTPQRLEALRPSMQITSFIERALPIVLPLIKKYQKEHRGISQSGAHRRI